MKCWFCKSNFTQLKDTYIKKHKADKDLSICDFQKISIDYPDYNGRKLGKRLFYGKAAELCYDCKGKIIAVQNFKNFNINEAIGYYIVNSHVIPFEIDEAKLPYEYDTYYVNLAEMQVRQQHLDI